MISIKYEKINQYDVSIVLPSGYDPAKQYRTIYMHDGGNGAIQAMNYIDHLIITAQIEPLIIIGIVPIDRNNEYTPWEAPSLMPNTPNLGGQVKNYLDTIVHQIKPYIDTHYATNPAPSYTAIAGCSFGGLASIFASYYYPEVFHQYIVLSASFWYEDVLQYIRGEEVKRQGNTYIKPAVNRQNHHLYLYVGELEGIHRDSIQKNMVEATKKAYQELTKEDYLEGNLLFELNPEGTHDVCFFSQHFIRALRWLYGGGTHQED